MSDAVFPEEKKRVDWLFWVGVTIVSGVTEVRNIQR